MITKVQQDILTGVLWTAILGTFDVIFTVLERMTKDTPWELIIKFLKCAFYITTLVVLTVTALHLLQMLNQSLSPPLFTQYP